MRNTKVDSITRILRRTFHEINPNRLFLIIYISVAIYIARFRMIDDIASGREPEYYPIEIISTIAVLLTVVLTYLIYHEKKDRVIARREADVEGSEVRDESESIYLALFIVFLAYYLAENNWLPGRDYIIGIALFGILTLLVFLSMLRIIYRIHRLSFWLFIAGIVSIAVGTFFDAMMEKEQLASINFLDPYPFSFSKMLFEEIPELYASLFFLHSVFLLYIYSVRERCSLPLTRKDGTLILLGAIIVGIGNSFFLQDRGETIWSRVYIGLLLYPLGILITVLYFKIYYANPEKDPGVKASGPRNNLK